GLALLPENLTEPDLVGGKILDAAGVEGMSAGDSGLQKHGLRSAIGCLLQVPWDGPEGALKSQCHLSPASASCDARDDRSDHTCEADSVGTRLGLVGEILCHGAVQEGC